MEQQMIFKKLELPKQNHNKVTEFKSYYTEEEFKNLVMLSKLYNLMNVLYAKYTNEYNSTGTYSLPVFAGLYNFNDKKRIQYINSSIYKKETGEFIYSFNAIINTLLVAFNVIQYPDKIYSIEYLSDYNISLFQFDKMLADAKYNFDLNNDFIKSNREIEEKYFKIDKEEMVELQKNSLDQLSQFHIDDIIESYVYKSEPYEFVAYKHIRVVASELFILPTNKLGYKLDFCFPDNFSKHCTLIIDEEYRGNCIYGYITEHKNGSIISINDIDKTIECIAECFKEKPE